MSYLMKVIDWFVWGLFFAMGWVVGNNVIAFVGSFMHK